MKLRIPLALGAFAVVITIVSCSSGLGNNLPGAPAPATTGNPNLPVGLDLGVTLTTPVAENETAIAGVMVPAIGAMPAREVVLVAFSTADDAAALSRDAVTDGNGQTDVLVAAVCAQDIEQRAFSQSLAGKFRHPRCVTCHSMQSPTTTAFVSAAATYNEQHAGPPPGPGFPSTSPETCVPCHVNSTNFPVASWQAPDATFDLRGETVAQLAQRATMIPIDETEHFVSDPRVLWALDSAILPMVGGRNGVADDDHDGVDEPEDRDGIARPVPGGSANFIREIEDWRASGMVVTAAAAVKDITLVSRAASSSSAGAGASRAPRVLWVPNAGFTAPGTVGTLFVVYESAAEDLAAAGDGNGQQDVFRTAIDLDADAAGNLDLVVNGNSVLCSATDTTTSAGTGGPSGGASIGGANGDLVAFHSQATDLVGASPGGGTTQVYLRNLGTNQTHLVSHASGVATTGGDGDSERPSIDATGVTIAYESDATDLIANDSNGVRDVFYARVDAAAPFAQARASVGEMGAQGTGGASGNASVFTSGSGRTLVAFESTKTDLATTTAQSNVFLFDNATGASTLLNQRIAPTGSAVGDGDARNPVIGADGGAVAFESDAGNIDVLRPDTNRATDVFLVETAQLAAGNVLPYRFSTTVAEAAEGDGASTDPQFGVFSTPSDSFGVGFAVFTTTAGNLGTSDSSNLVVTFLDETSGVLADFTGTPLVGTVPLQVQFTDTSSGLPTSWEWDFDDDGIVDSTEQNPIATYSTAGLYSVRLLARNANTEGTKTVADFVRARGELTADFSVSTTNGALPLTVVFADQSTEPFGNISAWSWDFDNDGTIDSTLQAPSFDYVTEGVYTVTFTVTGENGTRTVTRPDLITVGPPGALTAAFTSATSGYNNQSISFTDTSVGAATNWLWDFGDGGMSTQQNPTHTFATPGVFTVSLTVSGFGLMDTETKPNYFTSVPATEELPFNPIADSTIYEDPTRRDNGNGAGTEMVAGRPNGSSSPGVEAFSRRGLVRFDLSSIPPGSTINSASLELTANMPAMINTSMQPVRIHRLTADWTQGTESGTAGVGAMAANGGVTWDDATSPSTPWMTGGGDFDPAVSGQIMVTLSGTYTFTGANLETDVKDWVDLDPMRPNFGWLLRGNETAIGTAKKFYTGESVMMPPVLTVNFTRPLP